MDEIEKAVILLVNNGYMVAKLPTPVIEVSPIKEPELTKEQKKILASTVMTLSISNRAINLCKREGIITVQDLVTKTKNQLMSFNGMGTGIFNEITQALNAVGLRLKSNR